ncbi:hypothetical protein [Glycomyces sp. YM15]|uniref:hypothetical protein n=1 Tax=Glycomyces sp. YM15 TaxID=2800446 RepID=UPI0019640AEA|nr:hypothetical protein [Glycomyces sp. YM15]
MPCGLNYPNLGTAAPAPSETWSPIRFDTPDGNGNVSDAPAASSCTTTTNDYIEADTWPEASYYDPTRLGASTA